MFVRAHNPHGSGPSGGTTPRVAQVNGRGSPNLAMVARSGRERLPAGTPAPTSAIADDRHPKDDLAVSLPTIDLASTGWPWWAQLLVSLVLVVVVVASSVLVLHVATWLVLGHWSRGVAAVAAVALVLQAGMVSVAGIRGWLEALWAGDVGGRLVVVLLAAWPVWALGAVLARPRRRPVVRREPSLAVPAQRVPLLHGGFSRRTP